MRLSPARSRPPSSARDHRRRARVRIAARHERGPVGPRPQGRGRAGVEPGTTGVHAVSLRWAMVVVALAGFAAAALGIGVSATPIEPVAVDEPQYLMTAQSLW